MSKKEITVFSVGFALISMFMLGIFFSGGNDRPFQRAGMALGFSFLCSVALTCTASSKAETNARALDEAVAKAVAKAVGKALEEAKAKKEEEQ
jgi:hypothetical protein